VEPDAARGSSLLPEQERDLVVATEAGDRVACRQLVDAFLPSIRGIARHYAAHTAIERSELIQEGVVGLLRAASRYDPRLNTPFWAYASWWVRRAMQNLVAEVTGPVILSDRAQRGLARIKAARQEFVLEHGNEPTSKDLGRATGLTDAQLDSLLAIELSPRRLEEPLQVGAGPTTTLGQMISDPEAEHEYERVLDGIEMEGLRDLTTVLDERERAVLFGHYGFGHATRTLREIGDDLGVTAERVRQIEAAALKKLRTAAAGPLLRGEEIT
jgi:RNA polymerase sigma factor (sigma-70 family)